MRPPGELDSVDWSASTHAYGSAEDVPELIRALYSTDVEQIDEALYELYGNVHHQGSVYPATVAAVPFLAHAALHSVAKREQLLMLLVVMADQPVPETPVTDGTRSVTQAVRETVAAQVPLLLPCLGDPDRAVRRAAVRLAALGGVGAEPVPPGAVRQLTDLFDSDPVAEVRADALTALAHIDPDTEAARRREAAALDGPVPAVRLAAALLGLERSGPPYPSDLVAVLAADGAEPDPGEDDFPFAGLGTQEQRLTDLLTADPHAGLAVAEAWVAEGDLGGRGSWLADGIADTWRDREPQVVAVLAEALPQQRDNDALAMRLEAIARWIPRVREPDADVRAILVRHAATTDPRVSAAAQTALARCGNPRVLTGSFEPSVKALAELTADHRALGPIRQVLRNADSSGLTALISALTPATAEQLLPELIELLRTRRSAIPVARLLGTVDDTAAVTEPDLLDVLAAAMNSTDEMLRAASAASHARLSKDPAPAVQVLELLLSRGKQKHWYLPEAGRLGAAGSPLLPAVEQLLHAPGAWTRMAAAEAHWSITGDPERAVPVLAELTGASPVGLRALEALVEIGAVPEELRPRLRHLAWSPLRLMPVAWPPEIPHPDERLRAAALRLLSRPS
ncbi:HEAT repeat domain-containing protein [Streptomyces sp. NPDC001634]|uniref:HEAT repeat domain-containing protein n=1 Tax=Streptomyces sp. NPDC001634 TaxID=3154390 RepID=UPI00331F2A08